MEKRESSCSEAGIHDPTVNRLMCLILSYLKEVVFILTLFNQTEISLVREEVEEFKSLPGLSSS